VPRLEPSAIASLLPMSEQDNRPNLYDFSLSELTEAIIEQGQPRYRADQIWHWLYRELVTDFSQMTNLSMSLRESLTSDYSLDFGRQVELLESKDGQTTKVLFQLLDGSTIETVLMRYEKRRTVCISTQAGCAMGCVFCATGQMGFVRNLTPGEIINQVLHFARSLSKEEATISNIVLMGMGEPLHNYDNTVTAIDTLTDSAGLYYGARRITVSTVGLVPAIRKYADEMRQSTLAVSLHAATDEERDRLIPVNGRWPLSELMEACQYYVAKTGRRITFEWALIAGENDTIEQATALGHLLRGMTCHVNLIPLNPTSGYGGKPSNRQQVNAFQAELRRFGVNSSVRVRRGIDIEAGCGQLRERFQNQQKPTSKSDI